MPELDISTIKQTLVATAGVSTESLHICIGLAIFGLAVFFLHSKYRFSLALLIVLIAALFNELMDFHYIIDAGDPWDWFETLQDIFLSVLAPATLLLLSRYKKKWDQWYGTT